MPLNKMIRKKHETEVRKKILSETHKLFLEQGYHKTTIRQIIKKCDIKTGTVYHFFKNKEDIFKHLSSNVFDWVSVKADEGIDEKDVCLRFAREIKSHIEIILTDAKSRELYRVAYQSPDLSAVLINKRMKRYQALFAQYNPEFTSVDYLTNGLIAKGILQSIAVDWPSRVEVSPQLLITTSIHRLLKLYNVPQKGIEDTLAQLKFE